MGSETIFYYVTEETITGVKRFLKKRFWQKILPEFFVVEQEGMTIVTFLIPSLQKGWKKEKLLQLIQESAEKHPLYAGGVRILIQPQVQRLLLEQSGKKRDISETLKTRLQFMQSDALLSLCFPLTEKILRKQFPLQKGKDQNGKGGPESVVLLMGLLFFPEEQIQHFAEMIRPYLPRINAFTVVYAAEEMTESNTDIQPKNVSGSGGDIREEGAVGSSNIREKEVAGSGGDIREKEISGGGSIPVQRESEIRGDILAEEAAERNTDIWLMSGDRNAESEHLKEVVQEYTEELYYEYGLVSQVVHSAEAQAGGYGRLCGQSQMLFLDYGYSGQMPYRMLKEGGFYLDVVSSEEKEALFRRKYRGIFYQSPRKYLDTVVKSGYDK